MTTTALRPGSRELLERYVQAMEAWGERIAPLLAQLDDHARSQPPLPADLRQQAQALRDRRDTTRNKLDQLARVVAILEESNGDGSGLRARVLWRQLNDDLHRSWLRMVNTWNVVSNKLHAWRKRVG